MSPHLALGVTEAQYIEMGIAPTVYGQVVDKLLEEQREAKKAK